MNGFYIILQLAFIIIQMCSSQQYGDVRLVDGEDPSNGCLELFTYGLLCQRSLSWEPVCCNNFFNLNETAATVCRQMGYKTVESLTVRASYGMALSNITCPAQKDYINYGPTHVLRCDVEQNTDSTCECQPYIYCQNKTTYYNGEVVLNNEGYDDDVHSVGELLFYYNNTLLPVCCDSSFNKAAADSACRQLGYTGSLGHEPIQSHHRTSSWVISSTCAESYSCLKSCIDFNYFVIDQCDPCKLTCAYNTSDDKIYSSGSQSECMINIYLFLNVTGSSTITSWNSLTIVFASAFGGTFILLIIVIIVMVPLMIFFIVRYYRLKKRIYIDYERLNRSKNIL